MNGISRRKFNGYLSGGVLLAATGGVPLFGMYTCSSSTSVWTEIQQWVPVGISAFESIIALIVPIDSPAIDAIAEMVKAGFASLAGAIDDYINAPAADKASLGARVQLILTDIGNNIQAFLTAIGQSANPIVKVAVAIISIIVNTIAGFLGNIPGPVALKFRTELHVGATTVPVVPVRMSRASFISAVNEELNGAGRSDLNIPHKSPLPTNPSATIR
jgi:hypothetical protein